MALESRRQVPLLVRGSMSPARRLSCVRHRHRRRHHRRQKWTVGRKENSPPDWNSPIFVSLSNVFVSLWFLFYLPGTRYSLSLPCTYTCSQSSLDTIEMKWNSCSIHSSMSSKGKLYVSFSLSLACWLRCECIFSLSLSLPSLSGTIHILDVTIAYLSSLICKFICQRWFRKSASHKRVSVWLNRFMSTCARCFMARRALFAYASKVWSYSFFSGGTDLCILFFHAHTHTHSPVDDLKSERKEKFSFYSLSLCSVDDWSDRENDGEYWWFSSFSLLRLNWIFYL